MATTMVSQHFRQDVHQSRNQMLELKSPASDLGDVEADFQSLVNEMVQDRNKRKQTSTSIASYSASQITKSSSTSSSVSSLKKDVSTGSRIVSSSKKFTPFPAKTYTDSSVVKALPARVVPDSETSKVESEVVIEKQMSVKERIRKIEKQLSEESTEPPQPPEVIMPRGRSGSIRSLADQFENPSEGDQFRTDASGICLEELADAKCVRDMASSFSSQQKVELTQNKMIEGDFKNVKEVAAIFQEPITPITIRPPAPFSDSDTTEPVPPVPVLPPAMRKPPTPPASPVVTSKAQDHPPVPWKKEVSDDYWVDRSRYGEAVSSYSSSENRSVHNPVHYNAQVKCEVLSRVSTPEQMEKQQKQQQQFNEIKTSNTRRIKSEMRSSSSSSFANIISSYSKTSPSPTTQTKGQITSSFSASAPTPLARAIAKPPSLESVDNTMPKFSLLRSASAGSVSEEVQLGMSRAKSDRDIPKFNVKKVKPISTYGTKVWSPGGKDNITDGPSKIETPDLPSFKDVPPVWTPGRAGSASPSFGRKEYRRIGYEGSSTLQKRLSQENVTTPRPEESFAWKDREAERLKSTFGSSSSATSLPRVQSPTVTLLQKRRDTEGPKPEGQIPGQKPEYLRSDEGIYRPGEKLYTIKREYESEDEESGSRKFAVLAPKKFDGVGPTTRDGVPVTLRSGVKSEHQGEWYRRMFDSLHKVKDDDYIVIKYKPRRDTPGSKLRTSKVRYGGYMSEPEGYESDYGSRYATWNRNQNRFEFDDSETGSRYGHYAYGDYEWNTKRYVHQPGRIENYVPGFSSLSEKELRDNPEADVKLEIRTTTESGNKPFERYGGSRMHGGLKESGYESDSTLVFKKREDQRRQFDPKKTSLVYRQIQQGGEIPLSGLQKPAPPRPQDDFYVVYSDTPFGISLSTSCVEEKSDTTSAGTMSPPPSRTPSATFGEKKRTVPLKADIRPISPTSPTITSKPSSPTRVGTVPQSPTRSSAIPSPPRRLSSKWHPSLIKAKKAQYIENPPPQAPRSTSAERVRDTRALYSSWHREMVAKSREKLAGTTSPVPRPPSLELGRIKREHGSSKNFLLDRRAVSESRFTIQDKQLRESSKSPSFRSSSADSRVAEADFRTPVSKASEKKSKTISKELSKSKSLAGRRKPPVSSKRMYNSLERPPKSPTAMSVTSRSAGTSPARLPDEAYHRWSSITDGKGNVIRHTLSSLNKIKNQHSFQNGPKISRSHSAEERTKSNRHSSCLASLSVASGSDKKTAWKREKSANSRISSKVSASKKKLEPSESFDTTHSNETGYSSMLDLSPSPVGESKATLIARRKDGLAKKTSQSQDGTGASEREGRSLPIPGSVSKRHENRPHSAPALRTRSSAFFHERLEKWQMLSREASLERTSSQSSSRSTSPLRSLELVKRVSSSFKNIPKEPEQCQLPIIRSKSLETLSPSPHTHPQRYRQYILELRNAVPKSARISQLRRLFDSLEKIHVLERSVSTVELSAFDKKSCGVIDFETWKALRDRERKAVEYQILMKQLDAAQKDKDFFYRANVEKKWSGDCRLRGRDYCVNQLKSRFDSLEEDPHSPTRLRRREIEYQDTYKGLWRGSSVKDLSKTITNVDRHRSKRGSSLSLTREDSRLRSKGLWTSLSLEQINALREQLNVIYGSMQNIRSWRQKREMNRLLEAQRNKENELKQTLRSEGSHKKFINAGKAISDKISGMQYRPLSVSALDEFNYHNSLEPQKPLSSFDKSEERKKSLSKQLSMELQEKVAEQRSYQDKHYLTSERSNSVSPEVLSRSSPRTCYSLDVSDSSEPTSLTSNLGDQFLLVVKKPHRSSSLPNEPTSDAESSDSDASIRTVIQKDVAGKVKFFEKKARKGSRSSSKGSFLSLDPSEVPHYATLPLRNKSSRHYKKDPLGPSYLPERSVSAMTLNQRFTDLRSFQKEREALGLHARTSSTTDTSYSRSYLLHVKTGDVDRMKERYESPEDKRTRSISLSDIGNTLSRITPSARIAVRGQEVGDVKYLKKKYEYPRQTLPTDHWQPLKDEYLPKSKIASTLSTLATRSPSFNDPETLERVSRRDSVEKACLRRMHTGVVDSVVDKFESDSCHNDVSILGHMYTSVPSLNELARLSPLVPPRPPLPISTPPKKPLRSSSFSPHRLSKVSSYGRPLQTSTPAASPQNGRTRSLSPSSPEDSSVPLPPSPVKLDSELPKPFQFKTATPYDASAHIPKSRYTPPESVGAAKWTQSLERPRRLAQAMSESNSEISRGRAHSFSPPPRGISSLKYGYSRAVSPPGHGYMYPNYSYDFRVNGTRPLSPVRQNYFPFRSRSSASYLPQHRSSVASTPSYNFRNRVQSPPPAYPSRSDSLMLRTRQLREPRLTTRYLSSPRSYVDYKYESLPFYGPDYALTPSYSTYPLNRSRSHTTSPIRRGYRSSLQSDKDSLSSSLFYGTIPPRPPSSAISRDGSTKSVTFKEPVIGTLPYSSYPSHYGEPAYKDSTYKYKDSEVNIHYRTPVRVEKKDPLSDEELARRQEDHMKKVYEQERRKKYLSELEDIERRRHTDHFTPLQKSPIPLNRYDDEPFGGVRGGKTPEPRQVARALFNFSAQNKRELNFKKGDFVTIRRSIDRNWYEGEMRGIVGIFPCNYVEIVNFDTLKAAGRRSNEGQARARFNFQAQTAMEMSLSKGEMVILTRRVDENWYEGRIGNRRGILPVTYVETLLEPGGDRPITPSHDPIPRPALPPAHLLYNGTTSGVSSPFSTTGRPGSQNEIKPPYTQLTVNTQQEAIPYRALYNYKPQNEDELELLDGDIVLVMEKCDDGWFVGTSKRTGLFGTFPGNYVERC